MSGFKKCDVSEEDYARNIMLDDLQLAAELGKTLLERNKELETALKQHQNIIEDQAQEIEYLTKQTVALREVNDSRLRIYEQLEVSIQDLERANHRLVLENSAEKKHIKNLNATIESLESKCEEFQSTIDDLRLQVDILKRRSQRSNEENAKNGGRIETVILRTDNLRCKDERSVVVSPHSSTSAQTQVPCQSSSTPKRSLTSTSEPTPQASPDSTNQWEPDSTSEQVTQLLAQLSKTRAQCSREERRITELEEQLATMIQQNQALEGQVIQLSHHKEDEGMKSMHEEFTTLEEVRQGQLCSRCLRNMDTSSELPDEDDSSMLNELQHCAASYNADVQAYVDNQSTSSIPKSSVNPYKDLVEKYEALVEVHRKPLKSCQGLSLQEEMQTSGDFNVKDTDEESGHGDSLKLHKKSSRKTFSTPTDFSEAETSSSGFADETCNKCTQTEGKVGSFLCTIADGEDCKFSIYDDASPIDSRFRDRPEYRDLFKEIFNVLKKAAENKEEGDNLSLLDDFAPVKLLPKVPPVTPSTEQIPDMPDFDDDSQSVVSSTMSEMSNSQMEPMTVMENVQGLPIPGADGEKDTKKEPLLRPLVRPGNQDYISGGRKRSSSRRKNKFVERSDSPVTHIIGSPKIQYSNRPNSGRKRREQARLGAATEPDGAAAWNGTTVQFWSSSSRNQAPSPTPSQGSTKYEFKPSSASQDLHKLKKLDLSYAEVLRNADNKKRELYRQRQRK